MMRFLAAIQHSRFRSVAQIRKCVVKNPRKNQKNFFSHAHFKLPKSLRNPGRMHFPTPCTDFVKMSGATLFFIFL